MSLDQFTFGKSASSVRLAAMVSLEKPTVLRAVQQLLTQSNRVSKEIMSVGTHTSRAHLMRLHRRDVLERALGNPVIPEHIKTYVANVAIGHMKEAMRYSTD
jgi:hypothetical protein